MSDDLKGVSKKEAIHRLWEKGLVWWKLDSTQKDLYNCFHDAANRKIVWSCSRQLGKSTTLCVIAIEECLKKPNTIVKYVAPEQKMVRNIIRQTLRPLLADCPEKIRPKLFTQDSTWRFPNGSEIQMAGSDNGNAESLRGSKANLCIVDEAAFCQELRYLVNDILFPMMSTTDGKLVMASTPPESMDHDFVTYMEEAKEKGSFVQKTIMDNPRLTKEQIESIISESGGLDSETVQREFFCSMVVDSSRVVIPEFSEVQPDIIKPWSKPPFYDAYVSMDIGHKDLTVVLFAYYDFRQDRLIIEDEFVINGPEMTTDKLALSIKEKEKELWLDRVTGKVREPYIRVADNNLILINDLHKLHKLNFIPTAKDDADAALNNLRIFLKTKKIIINPKCTTLIDHLQNGVWDKNRRTFKRTVDKQKRPHHYDAIDALKYLIRNIVWSKNPYPADYDFPKGELFVNKALSENLSPFEQAVKNIFTVRSTTHRNK